MKFRLSQLQLHHLLRQRNMLITICFSLLVANMFQAITLFLKEERVVVVPADLRQGFWVEKKKVSPTYLEEMSLFLAGLCLSISPSSAAYQRDVILRYTSPAAYGRLKADLLETEKRLAKETVATHFKPIKMKVDTATLTADLTGDLITWVGTKQVSQVRETYRLTFVLTRGQLQLTSFKCLKTEP